MVGDIVDAIPQMNEHPVLDELLAAAGDVCVRDSDVLTVGELSHRGGSVLLDVLQDSVVPYCHPLPGLPHWVNK